MQFSRIYSNLDPIFTPIELNCLEDAKTVNVVYATVTQPKDHKKSSHNLGKTTLIHLIDFLLLKEISEENSFLAKHRDRFSKLVFFVELALGKSNFLTIRRSVLEPTKISFKKSDKEKQDFNLLAPNEWDHWEMDLTPAKELLDSYLDLSHIADWHYRVGISYFLRTQKDYSDYFQIQKFSNSRDVFWKPYLANVLGLPYDALTKKYALDDEIKELDKQKTEQLLRVYIKTDRAALATEILIKTDEIDEVAKRLDSFDFKEEEKLINRKLVDEVEDRITRIINKLYDLDSDIAQIKKSVSSGIKFDLKRINELFQESQVLLPEQLMKSYEELVEFNRKLTRERNVALKKEQKDLEDKRDKLLSEHEELNLKRQHYLAIIKNADIFEKYKSLQKELAEKRASVVLLRDQLKKLDSIADLESRIRTLKLERGGFVEHISTTLRQSNTIKDNVTILFNRYVKTVLGINGEFSVTQNKEGNIEFAIKTKDEVLGKDTSQSEGHTYHRLLSALFDLAVLKALENHKFYHFVYHDGILEGLDNRKKIQFLSLVREIISNSKIQYILSLIDSDLPRDEADKRIPFSDDEIILTLNDNGDEGRLFKMPPF